MTDNLPVVKIRVGISAAVSFNVDKSVTDSNLGVVVAVPMSDLSIKRIEIDVSIPCSLTDVE